MWLHETALFQRPSLPSPLLICHQVPYTNSVDVHSFGMILYELAHRGKRPYWQVTFVGMLVCFLLQFRSDASGAQLNQDFDLIRQKIIAGERPIFEDTTAPAESVSPRFFLPVLISR